MERNRTEKENTEVSEENQVKRMKTVWNKEAKIIYRNKTDTIEVDLEKEKNCRRKMVVDEDNSTRIDVQK